MSITGKRICNRKRLEPKSQTKKKKRVKFNVGGCIFETYEETLSRFPETLIGNKRSRDCFYCSRTEQHFFDRNRLCFESILYFYQSNGKLNCPQGVQFPVFEEECRYFELAEETINNMKTREGIIFDLDDDGGHGKFSLQKRIWDVLENPHTSRAAWIFGVFSLTMVIISIITALLETIHIYKSNPMFATIEIVLNIWFLTELTLRFVFTLNKTRFVQGLLNWIDFLAVIPFFILEFANSKETGGILGIFKTLKFLRVIRLFRLSKHSRRLKVVGIILKSCVGNFKLLLLCLLMIIFLGGSFIYFAEKDQVSISSANVAHAETFSSVLQGLWWGVQTITSVGYGDLVPSTIIGRTFSCGFMIFGVMTISVPVLTIVSKFTTIYPKNVECEAHLKECEAVEKIKEGINKRNREIERKSRSSVHKRSITVFGVL